MSLTFTDDQYQAMAVASIREYKQFPFDITDVDITTKYPLAIPLITQNIKDSLSINKSVSHMSQGTRSVNYKNNIVIIDDAIKLLIGRPYVRVFGGTTWDGSTQNQ